MDWEMQGFESSPIVHFIKDREGCYRRINAAYEQFIGLSRDQVIGKKDEQLFPPHLYRAWRSWESRILRENRGGKLEFSLNHEGQKRTFLLFYEPTESREREFLGCTLEITNRVNSEINLKKILNALNSGYFLVDPETRTILETNRRASEMIGLSVPAIIGTDCQPYICRFQNRECPVISNGMKAENREGLLINHRGEEIPILKTVIPLRLEDRSYIIESFTDISEQKRAENSLKETIEELEKFNRITIDREVRMIELKKEINQLCRELGRENRYKIDLEIGE